MLRSRVNMIVKDLRQKRDYVFAIDIASVTCARARVFVMWRNLNTDIYFGNEDRRPEAEDVCRVRERERQRAELQFLIAVCSGYSCKRWVLDIKFCPFQLHSSWYFLYLKWKNYIHTLKEDVKKISRPEGAIWKNE